MCKSEEETGSTEEKTVSNWICEMRFIGFLMGGPLLTYMYLFLIYGHKKRDFKFEVPSIYSVKSFKIPKDYAHTL